MRSREQIEATLSEQANPASQQATEQPSEPTESPAERIKEWRWKPGQSGNPAGRVKNDFAAEIARAVFEENKELVYQSMARMLRNGSAFGFQVLSDRAYGKLKEEMNLNVNGSLAERLEKIRKRKNARKADATE